jgi:hypothetical protein
MARGDRRARSLVPPDWSSVSDEYDAVHLIALAYPSTAGGALHCHNGATDLAG